MVSRSTIKFWLMRDFNIDEALAVRMLKSLTDEVIAREYGLTYLRPGWFARYPY